MRSIFGSARNRSTSQLATDASSTSLDATATTSHEDNLDILREIAEQMKRTPEDIEKQMQHSEGAALHAAILAGNEALTKGKSKQAVAAVIESVGGDLCGRGKWMCSDSILIAEAFVIGTRTKRNSTPQDATDLQYMRTGDGGAVTVNSIEGQWQ